MTIHIFETYVVMWEKYSQYNLSENRGIQNSITINGPQTYHLKNYTVYEKFDDSEVKVWGKSKKTVKFHLSKNSISRPDRFLDKIKYSEISSTGYFKNGINDLLASLV